MPGWTNWAGNQLCEPGRIAGPRDTEEVAGLVRRAAEDGTRMRVIATGHSFSPICVTGGLLLDVRDLTGVRQVGEGTATVGPATTVAELGELLWEHGLALANQGDIDTQQIAGAVSTGTHGSGIRLASFSSGVRSAEIVTAGGEAIRVDGSTPELLAAAQCSIGMLGVLTELEIEVVPAYRLRERIEQRPLDDVMAEWDELVARHRHFSFFWLPTEGSAALYGIETPVDERVADTCYVKIYDEAAPDEPDSTAPGQRVDRAYRIYPAVFEPNFFELEYFVPIERGPDAVRAMRSFMLANQPAAVFPLEVRTVAADTAWLSSQYGQATTVLSVSGVPGTDYEPYLQAVDHLLGDFDARVHWGKLHYLTRDQLHARYPRAADFIALRREHDPRGLFLNSHLRALFE
jgi:FAD/FMN-containing dehydrogenase